MQSTNVRYTMNVFTNGRFLELDNAHSHFLLADNGTVGRSAFISVPQL